MRWFRGQSGSAPIELVAGAGLLLFPTALLVLQLPVWLETAQAASVAAQQAARTAAIDESSDLSAQEAAEGVLRQYGRELVDVEILRRNRSVTVEVTVEVPAISLPLLGSFGSFDRSSEARQPLDPYRSQR